mgnify:CR=1 FL=1
MSVQAQPFDSLLAGINPFLKERHIPGVLFTYFFHSLNTDPSYFYHMMILVNVTERSQTPAWIFDMNGSMKSIYRT